MKICYCGNQMTFENCCQPFIDGSKKAPTATALMRSRYSAYANGNADYLVATTHSSTRKNHRKFDILEWSKSNNWVRLEIINSTETTVKFKAYYIDNHLNAHIHTEESTFMFEEGNWYYVDGIY
jgi:SEC-C motif-containing protein